jgi:hypothetical protein
LRNIFVSMSGFSRTGCGWWQACVMSARAMTGTARWTTSAKPISTTRRVT